MSHICVWFISCLYSFLLVCIVGSNINDHGRNKNVDAKINEYRIKREPNFETGRNNYGDFRNSWRQNQSFSQFITDKSSVKDGWTLVEDWPKDKLVLGQVSGVCLDSKGIVYIFHRSDRVWDSQTYGLHNVISDEERSRGPISESTVILIHPDSGKVLQRWGEDMFYIPHGITVDKDDNLWTTDVALHQVFKFEPLKNKPQSAQLTLGVPFVPGKDAAHFCKPTSVAVTSWGDFFVADGYCNSRIVKFDKRGVKTSEWGRSTLPHGIGQPADYMLFIPHALTIAEDKELVCVADRENGRVQCFNWRNNTIMLKIESSSLIGSRLFSVSYSPAQGGLFFLVNGHELKQFSVPVRGLVYSCQDQKIPFQFGRNLNNSHDIAVSPDGRNIYVAEIGPFRVWKYQSNEVFESFLNISSSTSKAILPQPEDQIVSKVPGIDQSSTSGILPAVLVTAAALIFAGTLLIAALVYSRAKRRGCGHCGGQGWMLGRHPAEGFKLGHFLGQHQGFQKVNTGEESEEEEVVPFA